LVKNAWYCSKAGPGDQGQLKACSSGCKTRVNSRKLVQEIQNGDDG
jgi:hypothetical protein